MSELRIDVTLVRNLVADQFPQWADLPITPVKSSGWDNRAFHLGADMSVRLPSAARYAAQVAKEQKWLPYLAPYLPLSVPEPITLGSPCAAYPFAWSVMRWLPGEAVLAVDPELQQSIAPDLGRFLNALRDIPVENGPAAGIHNFHRGGDLRIYDQEVRHCLGQLGNTVNAAAVLRVWTKACHSHWPGPPVWVHGDVAASNLLVADKKLSAVIDFGCCGVGDPACDLTIAWTVFAPSARQLFKETINLDRQTWIRAAGWALWKALLNLCKGVRGDIRIVQDILVDMDAERAAFD